MTRTPRHRRPSLRGRSSPAPFAAARHRSAVKAFIVENDPDYSHLLDAAVHRLGYQSRRASLLKRARSCLRSYHPDIALIDESLPDGSGLDLCREMRREHHTAKSLVVIVSRRRALWQGDAWLKAGADTCLPWTHNLARLAALVQGLIRRRDWDTKTTKPRLPELVFDPLGKRVIFEHEASAKLSERELLFLDLLSSAYPDTLSRAEIRENLFARSRTEAVDLALNELVRRLKKKLPPNLADKVHAIYCRGYRLGIRVAQP